MWDDEEGLLGLLVFTLFMFWAVSIGGLFVVDIDSKDVGRDKLIECNAELLAKMPNKIRHDVYEQHGNVFIKYTDHYNRKVAEMHEGMLAGVMDPNVDIGELNERCFKAKIKLMELL